MPCVPACLPCDGGVDPRDTSVSGVVAVVAAGRWCSVSERTRRHYTHARAYTHTHTHIHTRARIFLYMYTKLSPRSTSKD